MLKEYIFVKMFGNFVSQNLLTCGVLINALNAQGVGEGEVVVRESIIKVKN